MKRHNKEVLRAALFALISIFVMVGAAGLLYKEHKKKLEKERMTAAALWALESVPQAVYAPKLTVTPQPSGETEAVEPENVKTTETPQTAAAPETTSILSPTRAPQPTRVLSPTVSPVPEEPDYIIPDSSSRYLTEDELSGYTSQQLEIARNEIYARHGRKFVKQQLADYFNGKSWYKGTIDSKTFDSQPSVLNAYETANVQMLADMEAKKKK